VDTLFVKVVCQNVKIKQKNVTIVELKEKVIKEFTFNRLPFFKKIIIYFK
jgi:hypothetical protein